MRGAFLRFGADTPGPEFRGNSRERGRRSLTRHAQGSDPPLGAHTSPRRSGKADHGSRVCLAPRLCLGGAGGLTFGRRAAATGGVAGLAGGAFSGGARRAQTGRKAAHAGASRVPGCARAGLPGGQPGPSRARAGAFPGSAGQKKTGGAGQKNGRRRGKTGRSGALRGRVRRALGAKSPFLPRKGRATGLCWGENWRSHRRGV